MRISLNECDSKKRPATSSPSSRSREPDGFVLSSSKLSDKENHPPGSVPRSRPFFPDERFVCLEIPESYANKKQRSGAATNSSEVSSGGSKRSQAPKKSRHNYLKPGTLAKVRDVALQKVGRKRPAESDTVLSLDRSNRFFDAGLHHASGSPERVPHAGIAPRWLGPACLQRKKLLAPKFFALPPLQPAAATNNEAVPMLEDSTPPVAAPSSAEAAHSSNGEQQRGFPDDSATAQSASPSSSSSSLETLPPELLVRIVCRLDHNQLNPVFHVCRSLRQAVMIAQQCHFNFTTPGRDHKTVSDSAPDAKPEQALPFLNEFAAVGISTTPNAPKHAEKAPKPRYSMADMKQIAAKLFEGSQQHQHLPVTRAGVSHRVLFNEEELCKAIAQNTL